MKNSSIERLAGRLCGPGACRRFIRSEQGSLSVLTLYLLVCVMLVVGIAVDVVRFESKRARLQNTLDRAVLAAADMSQTLTPAQVVYSYMEKAGLAEYYAEPTSSTGFNAKIVSGTASGGLDTFFMNMMGINTLTTAAASTAEESISDIEISLVLDVSGSMLENATETVTGTCKKGGRYVSCTYKQNTGKTKIEALKAAADEFVNTIFDSTSESRTTMSIVPYSGQVNVGPDLLAHYSVSAQHGLNHCVTFATTDFNSPLIDRYTLLTRSDVIAPWYGAQMPPAAYYCNTHVENRVLPLGSDKVAVANAIQGMIAAGNTSIEIGMKWGSTLLDPGTQGVITDMIAAGKLPVDMAGRPFSYTDADTMKIIVVMTDGINTDEYIMQPAYRSGPSGVWLYTSGGVKKFSVYDPEGSGISYDGDSLKNEPYRWLSQTSGTNRWSGAPEGGAAAVQLTYPELFNMMSVEYHAANIRKAVWNNIDSTKASNAYNAWRTPYTRLGPATKNERLAAICNAVKGQGVIVFAIGFEVTDESATIMRNCSSSPAHFYRVQGLEITTAFQSIANAIGKLRLTQ